MPGGGPGCVGGPSRAPRLLCSTGTESLQTHRWREPDSNPRSRFRYSPSWDRLLSSPQPFPASPSPKRKSSFRDRGPMVRILLPPAASLQTFRPERVASPAEQPESNARAARRRGACGLARRPRRGLSARRTDGWHPARRRRGISARPKRKPRRGEPGFSRDRRSSRGKCDV